MTILSKDPLDTQLKEDVEQELFEKALAPQLVPNTIEYLTRQCMLFTNKEQCIKNTPKNLETISISLKDYLQDKNVMEMNKDIDKLNNKLGTNIPKFPLYMTEYSTAAYCSIAGLSGAGLCLSLIIIFATLLYTKKIYPETGKKWIIVSSVGMALFLALFLALYIPTPLYFEQLHQYELEKT